MTKRKASKKPQKVRGKLLSAHNGWRLLFKANCRRQQQPVIPWKTEVIRLTKEVAEKKHEEDHRWEEPLAVLLFLDCSQPFTSTEKVDSPSQTSRLAEGNPWKHIFH